MKYFTNCTTLDEAKKLYRKLSKENHPDLGGDTEVMKEINAEYEKICKAGFIDKAKNEYHFQTVSYTDLSDAMKTKYDLASMLKGIKIEIIGKWLWLTGETKENKETLKANGFKWSKKKNAWYFHEEVYYKRSRHNFTVDELRDMWGVSSVEKEKELGGAA